MADTVKENSQSKSQSKMSLSQSSDLASLRKSNRPKKPSLLYADGFEDTQKVIGRKGGNTKLNRAQPKVNNDVQSPSEKESDLKMEEEITERGGGYSEKMEFEDDDEYLPFMLPENQDESPIPKFQLVAFKVQSQEENKSQQRSSASNDAAGNGYQRRNYKKKAVYHEDFTYGVESKKSKDKVKSLPVQQKKAKPAAKTGPTPQTDLLDLMLSAAIKAQTSQNQTNENNLSSKSPNVPNMQSSNSYAPSGKYSTQKFGGGDEKPPSIVKKPKSSVKKTESTRPLYQASDELYQRQLEYKDHYIKEAVVSEDTLVLKHTKNAPISMKYVRRRPVVQTKQLLDSKLFDIAKELRSENAIKEEVVENGIEDENDWKRKLQEKENHLISYFQNVLKDFKPSILA